MVKTSLVLSQQSYRPARPDIRNLAYGSDHHASHPCRFRDFGYRDCLEISPNTNCALDLKMVSFLVLSRRVTGPARPIRNLAYGSDHHASHPCRFPEISAAGMCLEISPNYQLRIGFENGQLSSP